MNTENAYNLWASHYDDMPNKTRDLEKTAALTTLQSKEYPFILELGCGTGKNTTWLRHKATQLTALDFSVEMLRKAEEKIKDNNVLFVQSDLTKVWPVADNTFDLISCSLTLEHIQDIDFIFRQAVQKLQKNGLFFLCELHPFKQYSGSKARFTDKGQLNILQCFTHHVSEYTDCAIRNGFSIEKIDEWFDADDTTTLPRLISFVFRKTTV
ncbi:class I SAM-dependent methyltransferase [Aquimarina sp. TRL1]|nr:class I SAM-dependent methyltransferase [Aquimarina sp. TRL1]